MVGPKKKRIPTIALTGARMSGKNKIVKSFEKNFNIPTFDADVAFKFILHYDEEVRDKVRKFFGANSFIGHSLNTAYFDTDPKMRKLLEFAEEKVFNAFFKWKKRQKSKYVIFKFAALFELCNTKNFHSIISVFAPIDERRYRIQMALDDDMDHILDHEYPATRKNIKADFIIHNYDQLNIDNQLEHTHKRILKSIKK